MFKLYYRLAVMAISQISAKLSPRINKNTTSGKKNNIGAEAVYLLYTTILPVMFTVNV